MSSVLLDESLMERAAAFLRGRVRRTPVEESPALSRLLDVPVYLKLECLQLTGSFKIRGAFFALACLEENLRREGVVTCSAGNHGWALAYAAARLKVPVTVYLPRDTDPAKVEGIRSWGAEIIQSPHPGYDDTEEWALQEAAHLGRPFVSAYDDPYIMAGNGGSLALEVLEQVPQAGSFLLPVGGGGLAAGFSLVVKERLPEAEIWACQLQASPGLQLSLEKGEAVTRLPATRTLAGGLEGGVGRLTFPVLRERIKGVRLLKEEEILEGVRWMLKEHRVLVEPSGAAAPAAALFAPPPLSSPAVLVLTGRNVSYPVLCRILCGETG